MQSDNINDILRSDDSNKDLSIKSEKKKKELRPKKSIQTGFIQFTKRDKWKTTIFVFSLLILSILPPLFVVLDRWLHVSHFEHFPKDGWCKVDFLCTSMFQPYFSWIFVILGLISIIVMVFTPKTLRKIESIFRGPNSEYHSAHINKSRLGFRKTLLIIVATIGFIVEVVLCVYLKRIPGMELIVVILLILAAIVIGETEFTSQKLSQWIKGLLEKAPNYGTMIFSQVALIFLLREITSLNPHKNYLYYLPMVFAIAAVIWQRKKINKVFWLFSLALILFSLRMSSWKYSFIGDEYSFYFYPDQFISHQTFSQIVEYFFNVKGVYDSHPYFSSLLQYISMLFFGEDYFGWHLSNILLLALMIPMFYDVFKSFLNDRVAFLAVIPLTFSHYLINFSKIGYNNLQALFVMCLILWIANKAIRKRSFSIYFLLGVSLGACFYTFALGIFTIPVVGLFLLMFDPPRSKAVWIRYSFALMGLLVIITPIFFQPGFWSKMAVNTSFFVKDQGVFTLASITDLYKKSISNLLYTFFSFLYIPVESHYIVSSLVDPLLSVFLPIGFLLSIINFRRNRFLAFLTISFVLEVLIMSITNPYDHPTMTRMFLFIPFYCVFAMLGLDWLIRITAGIINRPGRFYHWAISIILLTACILNIVQSTLILDKRTERYPIQSTILRLFQHDLTTNPDEVKTYLFLTNKDFGFYFFETFVDIYHAPESKAQLQNLIIESPQIADDWLKRMTEQEDLVVILPYSLESSLFASLQPLLIQTGKTVCEVTDKSGNNNEYQLWYSQKYSNMCAEALSLR